MDMQCSFCRIMYIISVALQGPALARSPYFFKRAGTAIATGGASLLTTRGQQVRACHEHARAQLELSEALHPQSSGDQKRLHGAQAEVLEQMMAVAEPSTPASLAPALVSEHRHLSKIVHGFLDVITLPLPLSPPLPPSLLPLPESPLPHTSQMSHCLSTHAYGLQLYHCI